MEADSSILYIIAVTVSVISLSALYSILLISSGVIRHSSASRIREFEENKRFGARRAGEILEDADMYLFMSNVGVFLCALITGFIIYPLTEQATVYYDRLMPEAAWAGVLEGVLLVAIICLFLFLIHLPILYVKAFALTWSEEILCALSYPLSFGARVFSPFAAVINMVIEPLFRLGKLEMPEEREQVASAEDISELVERSGEAGELEDDECEMIQGVMELSDTLVREVMTPRKDTIFVDVTATLEQIVEVFTSENMSRILVVDRELDDLKGVLNARDFIRLVGHEVTDFDINALIRAPFTVDGTEKVDDLLQQLQKEAVHIAVVMDEHGGVDGIVTVEDLLEEIVGEIFDEYDSPEDEADYQEIGSGELLIDAGVTIDDFNEDYDLNLPEGEYDTLAGFVIDRLGHIPDNGETVLYEQFRFEVMEVLDNRITKIKVFSCEG